MEDTTHIVRAAAFIGAAIAIAFGTLGPSLGQGKVGAKACENIGKYPESQGAIRNAMFASLVAIETSSIYALLIAGALVFIGSR
jgi:F-type H+-transporting ATPase subunit c